MRVPPNIERRRICMKRLSLKATSLILALVLALSLSVTAFADDNAASMTRAEVTQEVIKNMGLAAQAEVSAKDASAFKDVVEGSKFEGAINLAYSKGIVNGEGGAWIEFDFVPEEHEVRAGHPDYTGRLCVIGSNLKEEKLAELFGL